MSNRSAHNEHATETNQNTCIEMAAAFSDDSSAEVRAELVVALHWLVLDFEDNFVTVALEERRLRRVRSLVIVHSELMVIKSIYCTCRRETSALNATRSVRRRACATCSRRRFSRSSP